MDRLHEALKAVEDARIALQEAERELDTIAMCRLITDNHRIMAARTKDQRWQMQIQLKGESVQTVVMPWDLAMAMIEMFYDHYIAKDKHA